MRLLFFRILTASFALSTWAATPADLELERGFAKTVKPFVAAYCVGCHSGANAAAQFDLKQYATLESAALDHRRWTLVFEKLHAGEMPPKNMKQPPAAEKQQVMDWVEAMRRNEARKNAGDPGPVLVRRLSNAEYNYSIRDLTGADLKPAREFPVDPTNPAGFDNTGESLSMSPALLNKYLAAAREVANNLVLKPAGIAFAPHPMLVETDREKYTIQRIVNFYEKQPTDFADYFQAAWRYKHRAALEIPEATLADVAAKEKVSPRYLPLVWSILEGAKEDVGPVARLQSMWRLLPTPEDKSPDLLREGCAKMRDYVVRLRKLTMRHFASPMIAGLSGTSQPIMAWKLNAYASHRRDFDPEALRMEGEPPPKLPSMSGGNANNQFFSGERREDTVARRNRILAVKSRFGDPDLIIPAGQRERYEASFKRLADTFPDAFYIRERGRFYPDDSEDRGRLLSAGFHNVMGYYRDDTPLQELILDEAGKKELDMLWLEFDTIGDYTTRTYVQFFFNQSGELDGRGRESGSFRPAETAVTSEKVIFELREAYLKKAAEGESHPDAPESIRDHFGRVNARIREVEKARLDAQPIHLEELLKFAARAFRRPLQEKERAELLAHYRMLRDKNGLTHDDAMRDMIVLVLMSPDFCYRVEPAAETAPVRAAPAVVSKARSKIAPKPAATSRFTPLSGYALASRLSYFLWSSLPDDELLARAADGTLHLNEVLTAQVTRMLKDKRAGALATEFAGNWLEFRRFEDHASVDRQRFPAFTNALRQAMFEEPVRFLDDLIRNDRSMLEVLYGKHSFVNRTLAQHYGIAEFKGKPGEWIRIDDMRPYGRGGILPMAAFLTRNSPGLRTSPVKRGYWVATKVLGEEIPPPPPSVPELPSDEAKMYLPLRQMLAKHREVAACATCHARFDSFGLAFEGYGPIGESRTKDLAGRAVDASAEFPGGSQGKGVEGLIDYIRGNREKDYIDNLCKKVLAYALGRSLLLPDREVVDRMREAFTASGYRFSALVGTAVTSPQFLNQRNPEYTSRKETLHANSQASR